MSILKNRRKDTDFSTATTLLTATITNDGVDGPRGPLGLNLLHSPPEPLINFVFVHGLGGGSRKTWSKTSSVADYWPRAWLPEDPAFKNTRVLSFGYDSDWIKGRDNCLNIHHFGKSLLGGMSTSPYLEDMKTPIVLIGHSMGGLVIKKAHILARQSPAYEKLAERFHAIYFLATPHRGSDSAKMLNNILQITHLSRAYVADLERGSGAIQAINDEFRNYSAGIDLWSFYETQKLRIGFLSTLIVDPDSATLGYPEEKQMPMNADHRSICKFETPTDPNYVILRNALASTAQNSSKLGIAHNEAKVSYANSIIVLKSRSQLWHAQVKDLEKYLAVFEKPEDELAIVEDSRMSGTCEWFSAKESYLKWSDFRLETPTLLWMTGRPAAGKSVLAGYAISQLNHTGRDCSYFFFKYGDKSKSRLSACLRSLAFQMACKNTHAREILLEIKKDGTKLDIDNERAMWQLLFLDGIFQTEVPQQYWVIDGLDECSNFTSLFDIMLAKLDKSIPLRVLLTSRETPELKQKFSSLGASHYHCEQLMIADTLPDIKLLIETKAKSVLLAGDEERAVLVEKILGKSEGSFLWTALVLDELSKSYGEEEINQVVEDMPQDMEPLYQRILSLMAHTTGGRKLAKAILIWTTCSTRPLTIKELIGALKIDINDNFPKLDETISALCGHLVVIDRFDKVQLAHGTVREFLLSDNLESEFAINKIEAHTRIARASLTYLTGEEMKPPRTSRRGPTMTIASQRAEFSAYACATFSYHLAKSDPLANDIMVLAEKFLKSNVLSWIEVIARTQNLVPLIRAAKYLRKYLDSCAFERSPLDRSIQIIQGWTTDFVRIVAKFADALIASPSAIYSLILPFIPTDSMIYKIARTPGRRLSVVGLSNTQWDDRLSCINFHEGQTSAICHGDELFAVGLTTGVVALYHMTSCQEYKVLNHGEAVRILQFKSKTRLLASCGMKTIRIWDTYNGEVLHIFQASQRFISLAFDKRLFIAASSKNYLAVWDLDNGGFRQPDRPWSDTSKNMKTSSRRTPCAITIAVSHRMLAVAYSGQPITLWDLEEDMYYGSCGKKLPNGETSTHMVTALVFNPNPNIGLLAVSYLDGELVLLDPFNDQEMESSRENCHTLAASPDGRLLAGGAGGGIIQIYEFDTLRLIYRVKSSNLYIKQLAFSRDSLHFSDIRGSHCNVWEPAALLRDSVSDTSSEGTSSSVVKSITSDIEVKITAIILHFKGEVVLCGKEDGSVSLYSLKTGAELRTLYRHKSLVRILTWWAQNNIVMSIDASNGIIARELIESKEGWVAEKIVFQSRLDCGKSIIQVLLGEAVGKFIISTRDSDHLWTIDGEQENVRNCSDRPGVRKWFQHQQSLLHTICIEGAFARIYTWSDWLEVMSVPLVIDMVGMQLKSVISESFSHRRQFLVELSQLNGSPKTRRLHLFDADSFTLENVPPNNRYISKAANTGMIINNDPITEESAAVVSPLVPLFGPQLAAVADCAAHIIGLGNINQLIFLDTQSWVCSVDLKDLVDDKSSVSYSRHFFIPYDWFAGTRDVISAIAQRDILFARNNEVAIIKGWLEYAERIEVEVK